MNIADRSARPQPEKDHFVAQGVHGERERGSRNRELTRLAIKIVPPRLGVVATVLVNGPTTAPNALAPRGLRREGLVRGSPASSRSGAAIPGDVTTVSGDPIGFAHGVEGRLATVVGDQCLQPRPAPAP